MIAVFLSGHWLLDNNFLGHFIFFLLSEERLARALRQELWRES